MEFDRAKNWTFDGGELTSRLDNGDMLMSFHFIDSLEREQTVQAEKEPEIVPVVDEVGSDSVEVDTSAVDAPAPEKGDNFTLPMITSVTEELRQSSVLMSMRSKR